MPTPPLSAFLTRWQNAGGAERANYQIFLSELCDLLTVPRPLPSVPDDTQNTYVFDRCIYAPATDGTTVPNFIDLYKRAHFVLETKQGVAAATPADPLAPTPAKTKKGHGVRHTKLWDDTLVRAKNQAEAYVRNIPDDNPPFLLVVDVGYSIETYADFSGLGKTYTPFPDNLSHRILLADLADPKRGPELLDRLKKIWTDPQALNPARRTAKVTRAIADRLAALSKSLEASHHAPEAVAHFLMRVLFTLFAEDVGLIPNQAFTRLLADLEDSPHKFAPMAQAVWQNMDQGGFSPVLREDLLRFNGGLFADTQALPLTGTQLRLLIAAAQQDWSDVEPAIFGTLLERALHPTERHKLGAHYTPRAYVERLVLPTVIEPLRDQWQTAKTAAIKLAQKGDLKKATQAVGTFLKLLCNTIVLDPACGTGNFLYVTLEHLKRLEGEVHDFLRQLGPNTQLPLEYTGLTVDPHQLRGIEINPRAAAITDLVLWIGYLQWHFRTHGQTMPAEPVLKKFDNIECRDAVLAYDKKELARDEQGKPLTRWDGTTTKTHPITGEQIPDDSARTPIYTYTNPRKAEWPNADYVVGNPPFIGNKRMVTTLGAEYAEVLRDTYPDVPESADFVMYWWDQAATILHGGQLKRFGLITTNSITQAFNRRILAKHLEDSKPLTIDFAIPDHPWTDSVDGAAVRIAMTVGTLQSGPGNLARVVHEVETDGDEVAVTFENLTGEIHPDLSVGANLGSAKPLLANAELCGQGMKLVGDFFVESPFPKGLKSPVTDLPTIRTMITPSDVLDGTTGRQVIDFFELTQEQARRIHPEAFQVVLDKVKPLRDQNRRDSIRDLWWRFAWERPVIRNALRGLSRYFVTLETSKHRCFVPVDPSHLWDGSLFAFAVDDFFFMGVLSSHIHSHWALKTGGLLGPTPRYNRTNSFEAFPFPDCSEKQKQKIRAIAEELDAHRKRQQAKYPDLTLTDMYNVLEKLRAIDAGKLTNADISPKDKKIHEHGLVTILRQLHDDLDAAVFAAYGWSPTLTDEALLEKLVALNHTRAAEEKRGKIRYLRPEFQNPNTNRPEKKTSDHH